MSRSERFLTALESGVVVADGAMGTELYRRGVSFEQCFDELCLSRPDLVGGVHRAYRDAGASLLVTNSFGANRHRLERHNLAGKVAEINEAAARIARGVAGDVCFVAGSIGPLGKRLAPVGRLTPEEAEAAFTEQILGLVAGGADILLFETFADLQEISAGLRAARDAAPGIPVIASMTFTDEGKTLYGYKPEEVARKLTELGAVAVGANCSVGPQSLMDVVERMLRVPAVKLMVKPNAGQPQFHAGRYLYLSSPEYLGETARYFVQHGCHLVGGCCGTTPEHVRAIRAAVEGLAPSRPEPTASIEVAEVAEAPGRATRRADDIQAKIAAGRFVSSVEIDPPKDINADKLIEGAALCKASGVDAINIADSPLARARMSPMALATLIRQSVDIEVILHLSCRDRNVIGLQSEVMGAVALGVRNVLCVTGDPPQLGDYPNAKGVFDVDSIGLVQLCARLNQGLDLAGRAMKYRTDVFVGVASNPTSADLETEVRRYKEKEAVGAAFTMTQPIYELDSLERFLELARPTIPVLVGILPLRNARHAHFLHHEVPGMFVPEEIRARMDRAGDKGPEEGVLIAQEFLARAKSFVQGVYLMPPFNQFWMGTEVLKAL